LSPAFGAPQVSKLGSGVLVDMQEKPNEPALQPTTPDSGLQLPSPVVPPLGAEPPAGSPAPASPAFAEAPPLSLPLPADPVGCLPADPGEPASESPAVPLESGTALSSG
jgi:hypothetical protein